MSQVFFVGHGRVLPAPICFPGMKKHMAVCHAYLFLQDVELDLFRPELDEYCAHLAQVIPLSLYNYFNTRVWHWIASLACYTHSESAAISE